MTFGTGKGICALDCGMLRSIFWPGALKVLYNELSKLNFDVVALQENIWKVGYKNLRTLPYLTVVLKIKSMNLTVDFMRKEKF